MQMSIAGGNYNFSEEIPSIEHFLTTECRITQFDADTVPVTEFKRRYELFC